MKRSLQLIVAITFIGLISLSASCGKGTEHDTIPHVVVNFSLDINSTMFLNLSYVGGFEYLTGGYKGIIVYRVGQEDFVAYDRACPYDPLVTHARLNMDLSTFVLEDTVCGSSFLVLDGSVVTGPSTIPLKRYNTSFDGNYLHIYN